MKFSLLLVCVCEFVCVVGGLWIVTCGRLEGRVCVSVCECVLGGVQRLKGDESCLGNRESGGFVCVRMCVILGGGSGVHSLPQHGDLVLDAALFPLQSLFRDALDSKHAASQLLLGQDHLGERSPVGEHTARPHVSRQCAFSNWWNQSCLLLPCWASERFHVSSSHSINVFFSNCERSTKESIFNSFLFLFRARLQINTSKNSGMILAGAKTWEVKPQAKR